MPAPALIITAIGIAGALGVATVAATTIIIATSVNDSSGVVERVVDGDTLDVLVAGKVERLRLLNIDAPEDNATTGISECLGAEATAELKKLLPTGTAVTLQYDEERYDRYDRVLAGVFVHDTFINAHMARAGLAGPLIVGDNDRFFAEVSDAARAAESEKMGIHGQSAPCTLGSIVAAYEQQAAEVASLTLPDDSAGLRETLTTIAAVAGAAEVAEVAIDSVHWVGVDAHASYLLRISAAKDRASGRHASVETRLAAAEAREEAEAARIAAETEAARVAAEAEADRRAADAQRQTSNRSGGDGGGSSGTSGSSGGSSGSSGGSPGGGYDGYTGCRAYGSGGTSIDEKGRPYTKIDCTTKAPIGG